MYQRPQECEWLLPNGPDVPAEERVKEEENNAPAPFDLW